jgi:hypothetical protein
MAFTLREVLFFRVKNKTIKKEINLSINAFT